MIADQNILLQDIVTNIRTEDTFYNEVYSNQAVPFGKNEFLFFLKPEVLDWNAGNIVTDILELVLRKIEEFGLTIHNINVIAGDYLKKYDIIAQHYGVINKLARHPKEYVSDAAKIKFEEVFKASFDKSFILGSYEFLSQNEEFTPLTLDILWQNLVNIKLSGGTYCEKVKVDDKSIFLINGFHPRQIQHFTAKDKRIITMTLSGDVDWMEARTNFIGATDPSRAQKGSIRRTLFESQRQYGLAEISQGANGVHLSAGPIEALVELQRYNSNFSKEGKVKPYEDFKLGKLLIEEFGIEKFQSIIHNINVEVDAKQVSIFDLTEELNSDKIIQILKPLL